MLLLLLFSRKAELRPDGKSRVCRRSASVRRRGAWYTRDEIFKTRYSYDFSPRVKSHALTFGYDSEPFSARVVGRLQRNISTAYRFSDYGNGRCRRTRDRIKLAHVPAIKFLRTRFMRLKTCEIIVRATRTNPTAAVGIF